MIDPSPPPTTEALQRAVFACCVDLVDALGIRAAVVLIAGDKILASKGLKASARADDHERCFAVGRRAALLVIAPASIALPTSRAPAIRAARTRIAAELAAYAARGLRQAELVPVLDPAQRARYGLARASRR
jgi:hypothetical protein